MSIPLVNDAVVFPDPIDWSGKVNWSRTWATRLAEGITGAEDRAAMRTKPLHKLEYGILAASLQDRSNLEARLAAAVKKGRACCPLWARPSELSQDAGDTACLVSGIWPWRQGDYAFFIAPPGSDGPAPLQNRVWRINAGGPATGGFMADRWYSGGSTIATADTIGLAYVDHPAPAAIYQTARVATSASAPNVITYTIGGLDPALMATVRLHFCEIDPTMINLTAGSTPEPRAMDVTVSGAGSLTSAGFWPYGAAHKQLDTATALTFRVRPSQSGTITITVAGQVIVIPRGPTYYYPAIINGIEMFQEAWEIRQLVGPSRRGRLSWTDPLRGYYPIGTNVFPVFFGQPTPQELTAITNRLGTVRLAFEEPLGEGALGVPGQCATEVCYDVCFTTPTAVVSGGPLPDYAVGATLFTSIYEWGNPGLFVGNAWVWARAMIEAEFALAASAYPGLSPSGPPYLQQGDISGGKDGHWKWVNGVPPDPTNHTYDTPLSGGWMVVLPLKSGGAGTGDPADLWTICGPIA
ncbi:MAG: hypothetical protein ACYDH9_08225 [Limisphaerales bacterium]